MKVIRRVAVTSDEVVYRARQNGARMPCEWLLIDGSSLIFRAYYGALASARGSRTEANVVGGFTVRNLPDNLAFVHINCRDGAIRRFETGKRLPPRSVGTALGRTLKSAGVIFTAANGDGPGVKLRKSK